MAPFRALGLFRGKTSASSSLIPDPLAHLDSLSEPSFEMFQEAPATTITTSIHSWGNLLTRPSQNSRNLELVSINLGRRRTTSKHQHEFIIINVWNTSTRYVMCSM